MGPKEDNTRAEKTPKYVWDPNKLAWVEATETAPEEAQVEPAEEAIAERVPEEGTPEEEVPAERIAVEAELESEALEYKGALPRLAGAIIDLILLVIIETIIVYTVGQVTNLAAYRLPIIGLVYFVGFWWWRGQTPGKMLIGAKIVKTDGTPMGVGRALLRFLFYLMPVFAPIVFLANYVSPLFLFFAPFIGVIVIGLSRQKRGVHDLIAGTIVVSTRSSARQPVEAEATDTDDTVESNETGEPETDKQQ